MSVTNLLITYGAYITVSSFQLFRETSKREKQLISKGYAPLGDSTYWTIVLSWFFKLLVTIILALTIKPVVTFNWWQTILVTLVAFLLISYIGGFVQAVVMMIISARKKRKIQKRLERKRDERLNESK